MMGESVKVSGPEHTLLSFRRLKGNTRKRAWSSKVGEGGGDGI
jgi:hypothetical protein